MITLATALRETKAFDGVVLMGPLIHIDPALASPMKIWAVRMLSRIAPNLSVLGPLLLNALYFIDPHVKFQWQVAQLDVGLVSRDLEQQEVMKNDHLRWKGGVKCKWAASIHEALTVNTYTFHVTSTINVTGLERRRNKPI